MFAEVRRASTEVFGAQMLLAQVIERADHPRDSARLVAKNLA
jgi:hypothetical protein